MWQTSICAILVSQLVLVLAVCSGVFLYTILQEEQSVDECVVHGEGAVGMCFDQYLASIETIGEAFITDISVQLTTHVQGVVDHAEAMARAAATAVEQTGYLESPQLLESPMETNGWHGSRMLPSLGWMLLGPLEEDTADAVVVDLVVASLNSTEEFNTWVWFGLASRNPNPTLACDFYYYRNATDATSSLWCLDALYEQPDMPSPSIYPHLHSPAIVKLQEATPCSATALDGNSTSTTKSPLVWMPLNFFVWTYNVVALTSVISAVHSPYTGECLGFAAANVRFTSMANYVTDLAASARYDNLSIALIETNSGTILGTSLGSAIYKENQTRSDGETVEQELPASLALLDHPLATALDQYIQQSYGSIEFIPTPLITSAQLLGQDYFLSFDTFERPMLNLTICAMIPHVSITGPTITQRDESLIDYEQSKQDQADSRNVRLAWSIAIGIVGLLASALIASLAAAYLSLRIRTLINYMQDLRAKISNLGAHKQDLSQTTPDDLCEPLPPDFFPVFETTTLKDLNQIGDATKDLCGQLLDTWNDHQEIIRKALEQRQFTASIAHDIRNPLHGVLGIVSMMQSDLLENKEKLPLLADTLQHMSVLLNDMVDLSKIQGGKVTHDVLKPFDAWHTLQEVHVLYQSTVREGGGSLVCMDGVAKQQLPLAYSDPVHVQRIITNFVSNASKYAAGCDIVLKAVVATPQRVQDLAFLEQLGSHFSKDAPYWTNNAASLGEYDRYLVLACLDKGRGIPATKLNHVFEAYQQTRTSDRYQGAGLGLAIACGLAVGLGGGIGVQSLENCGSVFWLVVPCAPKDKLPPQDATKSTCNETSLTTTTPSITLEFTGCHVLVVDDTNLNLMLLKHFLTKLKMQPVTCESALDGLAKLREAPDKFSIIISDFHMPEMHGGVFCLEVRKDPRLCHLPFICSSGNNLTQEEKDQYKIDDTLMKPFTSDQLQDTIGRYIYRPSKWSGNVNIAAPLLKGEASDKASNGVVLERPDSDNAVDTAGISIICDDVEC